MAPVSALATALAPSIAPLCLVVGRTWTASALYTAPKDASGAPLTIAVEVSAKCFGMSVVEQVAVLRQVN